MIEILIVLAGLVGGVALLLLMLIFCDFYLNDRGEK